MKIPLSNRLARTLALSDDGPLSFIGEDTLLLSGLAATWLTQKRCPFPLTDENLANFRAGHLFLDLILAPTTHKSDGHGIYEEREVTVLKPRLL